MQTEVNFQGDGRGDSGGDVGGGPGGYLSSNAYDNPNLTVSANSVETEKNQDFLRGSNDFIPPSATKFQSVCKFDKKFTKYIVVSDEKPSFSSRVKRKVKNTFSKKTLYKRIPIMNWLPKYNCECAIGDLVAGITVGLTVIPQSLAYANIAGLPPQYGLYGSFVGCFIYIFLGSCKDVPVGPTAIVSLLTFQTINGRGAQHAILLCFLTGIVQILMGILGLGFLIDFVSGPVSSGFTSAVALIIITSQIKDVLGIQASGTTFINTWKSIFSDIHNTTGWDAGFGVVCIVVLLLMRLLTNLKIGGSAPPSKFHRIFNNACWLIGTSRNTILVVLSGVIGYFLHQDGITPFKIIGVVPQGLPTFQPPQFSDTNNNNGTEETISFVTMLENLSSGIVVVPLVGLLEDIAICKAFANGKTVDATQELLAIGVSNVANSFFQAFPGGGSLSRSAVNNSSGVKTPLGGLYTGIIVIVALLFFTPSFYYIPKSCLAAIIIAAVIFMVEVKVVRPMWRTKKSDLILGLATFIACLALPLEYGILIGISINLMFILYHAARPKISVERLKNKHGTEYLMLTPDRCLIFPSVDYMRNLVIKHSIRQGIPVVIDCSHIYGADYTAATVIEILVKDFESRKQSLFFYNLKPSVCAVFEGLTTQGFYAFYNPSDIDHLLKNDSSGHEEV